MKIQEWANTNEPSENMIYYRGYWDQICFIRDQISYLLFNAGSGGFEESREKTTVISTHVSKSIRLPVYHLDLKDKYGLEIVMRYNFHDWKVTVKSDQDILCDFGDLFLEREDISYLYCEGMDKEYVCGMYKNNKKEFTVEIYDNYRLYTFMWILKNDLKSVI